MWFGQLFSQGIGCSQELQYWDCTLLIDCPFKHFENMDAMQVKFNQ